MNPESFLKTIYLGDRACKGIVIETWERKLKVLVDTISRIRSETGKWNYYTDEDIPDGFLVLEGVQNLRFDPPGPLPNDLINSVTVRRLASGEEPLYEFSFSISSCDATGNSQEVTVTASATGCYLEDPQRPGERIY